MVLICFYWLSHKHNYYFYAGIFGSRLWSTTHIGPLYENAGPLYKKGLLVQKLTINSLQKATPSSNKFTNVQETVDELDGCHEGRYNIEVTKLKTVTML